MTTQKKHPGEELYYLWDFSPNLEPGEEITAAVGDVVQGRDDGAAGDLTITPPAFAPGTAGALVGGGTAGRAYILTVTVETSLGNTRVGQGQLRVSSTV